MGALERDQRMTPEGSRGFSLIELLVVVVIITVLAGIMLSAVGLVRKSARDLACASNLRQIALGIMGFAKDHEGRAPGSGFYSPYGTGWGAPPQWPRWVGTQSVALDPTAPVTFSESYAGQSASTTEPATCLLITQGYLDGKRVFACPASDQLRGGFLNAAALPENQYFAYGLNLTFCGNRYGNDSCGEESADETTASWRKCPALGSGSGRVGETVLMTDLCTRYDFAFRNTVSVDGGAHPGRLYIGIAPHRDGRRVNAVYCDGHVAACDVASSIYVPTD